MIKRMIKPQPTSTTRNLVRQRFRDERFQRLPADALASGLPSAASSMPGRYGPAEGRDHL
jgi:hypothetical protein